MPKKEALMVLNEIELHAIVGDCPYIVQYIDSFIQDTRVNIIMEYCSMGDLQGHLQQRVKNKTPLDL